MVARKFLSRFEQRVAVFGSCPGDPKRPLNSKKKDFSPNSERNNQVYKWRTHSFVFSPMARIFRRTQWRNRLDEYTSTSQLESFCARISSIPLEHHSHQINLSSRKYYFTCPLLKHPSSVQHETQWSRGLETCMPISDVNKVKCYDWERRLTSEAEKCWGRNAEFHGAKTKTVEK